MASFSVTIAKTIALASGSLQITMKSMALMMDPTGQALSPITFLKLLPVLIPCLLRQRKIKMMIMIRLLHLQHLITNLRKEIKCSISSTNLRLSLVSAKKQYVYNPAQLHSPIPSQVRPTTFFSATTVRLIALATGSLKITMSLMAPLMDHIGPA